MEFKNLNRYRNGGTDSKMQLTLRPPRTPDGRVYRFSPNENAHPRHFVIGEVVAEIPLTDELRARMKHEPRTKQTVCPYSGVDAPDDAFTHPEDVKAALEVVKHAAMQDVEDYLADAFASAFKGRSSSKGFVTLTAKIERSTPRPKPRFARQDLMRELVCDHCGRDYGVFAIGLFCPDCGAPNLRLHFAREAELVDDQVGIAEEIGGEREELAYRLLGNAHEDVLTAFEATLKSVYLYGKSQAGIDPLPKVGNDFQNVDKALKRFEELRLNPFEELTEPEMAALRLNIQKRHIIGHNLSVIDDKFATQADDAKVGETVAIVGEDIRQFAAISQKVIDKLDTWLCGAPSPTRDQSPLRLAIKEQPVNPDDPKNLMALDLELSLLARKLALWIAAQCPDGTRNFVNGEQMRDAFRASTDAELQEAIAELKTDGFIQTAGGMGAAIPAFRPTVELYLTFDGIAFGNDPSADAAQVAEIALTYEHGVDVGDLFKKTGWTLRRFNPIIDYIASQVPDGRVSRCYGTGFTVNSFVLLDEDRVNMKRFIKRLRG